MSSYYLLKRDHFLLLQFANNNQTINHQCNYYVAIAINDSYVYIETISKQISHVIYSFEAVKSLRLIIGIINRCFVANLRITIIALTMLKF